MRSSSVGKSILKIEITNIDSHGIWLFLSDREYFLSYKEYPWFKDAKIKEILNVELLNQDHIYWPDLDIDLKKDILEAPDKYPLKSR